MGSLREQIQNADECAVFYELIPPPDGTKERSVRAYAECAAEMIASTSIPIDGVNLPEIHDEQRNGKRTHEFKPKADPRKFGRCLREAFRRPTTVVINRCTVLRDRETQETWLKETVQDYGISYIVLVGGESSRIRYPGPSVLEMASRIRDFNGDTVTCGGITIPTRRSQQPARDEPNRLIEKCRHGIEFFTSQVLYEPQSTQRLLRDYQKRCDETGERPRRIFLSFAPISTKKDLQFLKWLGVEVPEEIETTLFKTSLGVGWRSVRIAEQILTDILDFVQAEGLRVPLGLNIEHITQRNFELSKDFIESLGETYYSRWAKGRHRMAGGSGAS